MNERENVRIFLQSLRTLPEENKCIRIDQANQKIQTSHDDIFSLYELILQLKGSQVEEKQKIKMLRRLLSLLSLICDEHKIYYSKLTILKSFWEDAGIDLKMQLMFQKEALQILNDKRQKYQMIIFRDEHYYLILRFCNVFIKESIWQFQTLQQTYSIKMYLMHLNLPKIWKVCKFKIKQIIESHSNQSFIKIKLCIEYCKFLLTLNYFTIDQNDIDSNFVEFLTGLRLSLRIMKKLYSVKAKKYIPLLKNVIKNSIFIYNNKIEHEKLRGLQKIEELINKRKHVKIEIKNQTDFSSLHCVIYRILNSWRSFEQRRKREITRSILDKTDEKFQIREIKIQKKQPYCNNEKKFNLSVKKTKFELKRKKTQSLHVSSNKNKFINSYQIKSQIKAKIEEEFNKENERKRIKSEIAFPKIKKDKKEQEKQEQEYKEMKLQDYVNPIFLTNICRRPSNKISTIRHEKKTRLKISIRESKLIDIGKIEQ